MKIGGIVGGIGPEATLDYYRLAVELYREKSGGYPRLVIDSIDLGRMLDLMARGRLDEVAAYLIEEVRRLARAGADFAALAANTAHVVFEEVRAASPIPLLSIVEATRDAAAAQGLTRLALLGTRYTMQARFYPEVLAAAGMACVRPAADEQAYIHEKYLGELVNGVFRPETRQRMLDVIARMKAGDGIDGVILGGTELPLLLPEPVIAGVPALDTTALHVAAIVSRLLAARVAG
jgi:aspartate racemase